MSDLDARLTSLELAVTSLAMVALEAEGHPFHGNQWTGGGEGEAWTPGGKPAQVAAVKRALEKAGLKVAGESKAAYNHRGQMVHGATTGKGIDVHRGGSDTRLSWSFGGSAYSPRDSDREHAAAQLELARQVLHDSGFETRELGFLPNTYEVQRPPKVADRVAAVENAVTSLATLVLGAQPGHPFFGNQWTDGMSSNNAGLSPDEEVRISPEGTLQTRYAGIVAEGTGAKEIASVMSSMRQGSLVTMGNDVPFITNREERAAAVEEARAYHTPQVEAALNVHDLTYLEHSERVSPGVIAYAEATRDGVPGTVCQVGGTDVFVPKGEPFPSVQPQMFAAET